MKKELLQNGFTKDVYDGLTSNEKYLSSKYFYDERGSEIFRNIMRMPEYYLTDCELEVFEIHKNSILKAFGDEAARFELLELGAGDGLKTKVLLKHFLDKGVDFKYSPIDISEDAVRILIDDLKNELPDVKTNGLVGDYFNLISNIMVNGYSKKIIFFLGSNIGNFDEPTAIHFLKQLRLAMNPQDQLLIGFDLKKDPQLILDAYNDPHGHTAAFNLNLLQRINDELRADFNLDSFMHREEYNPETGTAKSFLVSLKKQQVTINEAETTIGFEKDEKIFMEMSQKYDLAMINDLAANSGLEVVTNFFDSREYFVNSLWKSKS